MDLSLESSSNELSLDVDDFIFEVPIDAEEDAYTLTLQTFYDWDDDEDEELDASYDE